MKILITGGSGFVGSYLAKKLLEMDHDVRVLELVKGDNPKVEYIIGSLTDDEVVNKATAGIDIVYHLAAQIFENISREDPKKDNEINAMGTITLLEGCRKNNVKRIIFASTATVYGIPKHDVIDEAHESHPVVQYGCSKLSAENYIKAYSVMYGIKYTILRFFNIYGGTHGKGVINIFFNKALAGENITILGDGMQYRDFLYIDDAIDAYLKALDKNAENQTFNIGSGRKTTIKEIADKITSMVETKSRIENLPQRDVSSLYPVANYGRARIMMGFEPKISLEEGLKLMYNKLK